jgi:hypothetical protein
MIGAPRRSIGARVRYDVLRRDNYKCRYCGASTAQGPLYIDHVTPVHLGGTNDRWNLTASCEPCNLGKGEGMPSPDLIFAVREAETNHEHVAHGRSVQPCTYCRCPVACPDVDGEGTVCQTCERTRIAGWREGYEAGLLRSDEALVP